TSLRSRVILGSALVAIVTASGTIATKAEPRITRERSEVMALNATTDTRIRRRAPPLPTIPGRDGAAARRPRDSAWRTAGRRATSRRGSDAIVRVRAGRGLPRAAGLPLPA